MFCQKFCRLSSMAVTRKYKTSHRQACGRREKRFLIECLMLSTKAELRNQMQ
jgi:hypothetical protein